MALNAPQKKLHAGLHRFEGFVPHDHPAAGCNCHRFDPFVRTGPSECDQPSQHLTHGAVGGLGISVWRWARPPHQTM